MEQSDMSRSTQLSLSRYATEAALLFGHLIRARRMESTMTGAELAARIGISRQLLYRIERGDPKAPFGAVLETAAALGIPLFDEDRELVSQDRASKTMAFRRPPSSARLQKTSAAEDF